MAMNMTARLVWEDVLWVRYGRICVVNKSLPDVSNRGAPGIIQSDRSKSHFLDTFLACQMIHLDTCSAIIVVFACLQQVLSDNCPYMIMFLFLWLSG